MFLAVDLGTPSVKSVIINDSGALMAEASAPLQLSRLQRLWSEQAPDDRVSGAVSPDELASKATDSSPRSGRQEYLENHINSVV